MREESAPSTHTPSTERFPFSKASHPWKIKIKTQKNVPDQTQEVGFSCGNEAFHIPASPLSYRGIFFDHDQILQFIVPFQSTGWEDCVNGDANTRIIDVT